jgi:hypothetical protein
MNYTALEELAPSGGANMISLLMCVFPAMAGTANDSQPAHALSDVHHIYVESMGHDDEAVRFLGLLKQELIHQGLTIEDDSAKADAVLSGTLSVRVIDGYSRGFADVVLRATDGATIWQGSFGPRFLRGRKAGDDIKNVAGNLVDRLVKDRKQSTAHR